MIEKINIELIRQAASKAFECCKKEAVADFLINNENYEYKILEWLKAGIYPAVEYHHKTIKSRDGKLRKLSMCSLRDRIMMHVILLLIKDKFMSVIGDDAYNCIPHRGINSKYHRGDPNHMLKRYMSENHWGYLQTDIAKCYESTSLEVLQREQRRLLKTDDEQFLRLLSAYSFCEIGLPIGTPMSPFNHHIIMMCADRFIKQELKIKAYVRYADDMILFGEKQQLHEAAHRLRNFLWYTLNYKLKKEVHPTPSRVPLVVLGFSYLPGHTRIKRATRQRMKKAWSNPLSRASYLGILSGADAMNLTKSLNMNFSDIVNDDTIVTRRMDSPLEKIENITGKFDILDFEVREADRRNGKSWMRMQLRCEQDGKQVVRLIKGYQPALCIFLANIEKEMHKRAMLASIPYEDVRAQILPIENAEFENKNGWIFKGTVNTLQ